ncbi:DUF2955 domain-containing protein [Methylopila sp. 73B]|uniref:DUF2955 domain-containing protein n=1 Tax=Methylopila sp. 73B TaxID=1120792 RepID=UPI000376751C|nr:DUF2955 domain-containing protein [Methylopila sp. 73B]
MSAEAVRTEPNALLRSKRQGLRIASAVAVGFTVAVANGEALPFLAPMFAIQFLAATVRPLTVRQAFGMVMLIVVAGWFAAALTQLCGDRPAALLPLLGLVYLACFLLQARGKGGGAPFLIIVVAVMVPMLGVLQTDLGEGVVPMLAKAVLGGVALAWLAHAAFPDPGGDVPAPAPPAPPLDRSARLALANTAILLIVLTVCLVDDRFSNAVVVPITAASLLNQFDHTAGSRAALGLVGANLLGGVVASVAFAFIDLRPTLPFVFFTLLFVALMFGGQAAANPATAKVYAGALTTFVILLGLGVSPLPGSAVESFSTRIGMVTFAIAATLLLTGLLRPTSTPRQPQAS